MVKKVHIFFDFVCPFCFLGIHKLGSAVKNTDTEIIWHPYELSPGSEDTLDPVKDNEKLKSIKKVILPSAKELGIFIKFPNISPYPHTTMAFYGMQYAKEMNVESQYIKKVFSAFFQENKNIGKPDILKNIAGNIGLDKYKFREALKCKKYRDLHEKALRYSYEDISINVIPTYVIGEKTLEGEVKTNDLRNAINY
ncbi:DsbA family oxidoreductase [Clostridium sp. LBM24168]